MADGAPTPPFHEGGTDRTFLEFDAERQGNLVNAVSDLGRSLGLSVIAEGVETADHVVLAQQAGSTAIHGFYLARPLPEDEIELLLHRAALTGKPAPLAAADAP